MIRELASELRADVLSAKGRAGVGGRFHVGPGDCWWPRSPLEFSSSRAPSPPWSSQGVALVLFGNFAACMIIALTGGFRGAISGLSPALVIVMASVRIDDGGHR